MPRASRFVSFVDKATGQRECTTCHEVKPFAEYYPAKTTIGVGSCCRACFSKRYAASRPPSPKKLLLLKELQTQQRQCRRCNEVKPLTEYYRNNSRLVGRSAICKACHGLQYKGWITPSSKKMREAAAARREAWLDQPMTCKKCGSIKKRRDWPKEPGKGGHYNKTCCMHDINAISEPIAADGTRRCRDCQDVKPVSMFPPNKRNSTGIQAYCYDCSKERTKIWKHAKPSAHRAQRERRYRRLIEQSDGTIKAASLRRLFLCSIFCPYCFKEMGKHDKTLDHIVPVARGGKHSLSNVTVCCKECNTKKSAKDFDAWLEECNIEKAHWSGPTGQQDGGGRFLRRFNWDGRPVDTARAA